MNPGLISPSKLAANRANAQLSTGPITEEGKAASSKNAIKLGFTGRFILLPNEDRDDFDKLRERLRAEHRPDTDTELILVENLAKHHWLMNRALRYQSRVMENGLQDEKLFALMLRYQTTQERAFHRSLNQLLKLRKEREAREVGFVSQNKQMDTYRRKREAEEIKLKLLRAKLERLPKPAAPAPIPPQTEIFVTPAPEVFTHPDQPIEKRAPAAA